jgi:hypothetical protein
VAQRDSGSELHGLQLWIALPKAHEEAPPRFHHHPAPSLPELELQNVLVRVIAGAAYGQRSPVETLSELFYVHAELPAAAELHLPDNFEERGAYVLSGAIQCGATIGRPGELMVFSSRFTGCLQALEATRLVLIGGEPLDAPRHLYWNFVSSSEQRIERAKQDWRSGAFGKVPGDDVEFIPLPD